MHRISDRVRPVESSSHRAISPSNDGRVYGRPPKRNIDGEQDSMSSLTVTGRAENIEGSAAVVTMGGDVAYIDSGGEWDFDIVGKEVIIIGQVSGHDRMAFTREDRDHSVRIILRNVRWKFRMLPSLSDYWPQSGEFMEFPE